MCNVPFASRHLRTCMPTGGQLDRVVEASATFRGHVLPHTAHTHVAGNDSGDTEASFSGHTMFVGCRGDGEKIPVEKVYTQDIDRINDGGRWCQDGTAPIWVGKQLVSSRTKQGDKEPCTTLPGWTEAMGEHCCRSQNEVCIKSGTRTDVSDDPVLAAFFGALFYFVAGHTPSHPQTSRWLNRGMPILYLVFSDCL